MRIIVILVFAGLLFGCGHKGPKTVSFHDQVQPILNERCVRCHGSETASGKVVLTSYDNLMAPRTGSRKKPPVVPGNLSESWIYILCGTDQPHFRMPPDTSNVTPLPKKELEVLGRWIMQGAMNN
jgi:uncharacterized membrane protein